MSSLVRNQSYPASFKGVQFVYLSCSYDVERKEVVHDFINDDLPDIEDLGLKSRIFTVNAIVKGLFYVSDKKALETVLNDPTPGYLVHPYAGQIWCKCQKFTCNEDNTKLGIAAYTITFAEVKKQEAYPAIAPTDLYTQFANIYNDIYSFIADTLDGEMIVGYIQNVEFLADKLGNVASRIDLVGEGFASNGDEEGEKELQSSIDYIIANKYRCVLGQQSIGQGLTQLYFNFDTEVSKNARFLANERMVGFGFDDVYFSRETFSSRQLREQSQILNGTVNSLALAGMYDSVKNLELKNRNEIESIAQILEDSYQAVITSDKCIININLLRYLQSLRHLTSQFLNSILLISQENVLVSNVAQTAFQPFIYGYYGNTDNYNSLRVLNNVTQPFRVRGDLVIYAPQ